MVTADPLRTTAFTLWKCCRMVKSSWKFPFSSLPIHGAFLILDYFESSMVYDKILAHSQNKTTGCPRQKWNHTSLTAHRWCCNNSVPQNYYAVNSKLLLGSVLDYGYKSRTYSIGWVHHCCEKLVIYQGWVGIGLSFTFNLILSSGPILSWMN